MRQSPFPEVGHVEDRIQRTLAVELTALEQRCEDLETKFGHMDGALRRLMDAPGGEPPFP